MRSKAEGVLERGLSEEAGTVGMAGALTELRRFIDEGADGPGEGLERWERIGVVVEVCTSSIEHGSKRESVRAFLRQISEELKALFAEAEAASERRSRLLWWLWRVVRFDIDSGSGRLYEEIADVWDENATVVERRALEDWLEAYLDELSKDDSPSGHHPEAKQRDAGFLLLRLLWDELGPEERLALAEETGQVFPQMSALLELGRFEEATELAGQLESEYLPDVVLMFGDVGQLDRLRSMLPEPGDAEVWPEVACNLAGAFMQVGEVGDGRDWAVRAIREAPKLDFLDFWREHAEPSVWRQVEEDILDVLSEVDPLVRLHHHLRVEEFEEAERLWGELGWSDGSDPRFEESTARQLANMAKQSEAYRLAVNIGTVCARHRLATADREDVEQVRRDYEESRELLMRAGAEEDLKRLESELGEKIGKASGS